MDQLRCALPNASTGSLDATLSGTRFLRERLILLCKVFALIDVSYLALFTLGLMLDTGENYFTLLTQAFSLEALGEYLLFALVYLACRAFGDNLRALRVLDACLLLGLGCLWSSWCFMHPYPALGAYEMMLALVGVPVLRAVLVPSSGLRTLLLTAAACAPGLISSFVAATLHNTSGMSPLSLSVFVFNWCVLSMFFSTVASSVVYGLRSEVRRARKLGQYTLVSKLGAGGMGVVYLAQHALLRRRTVIKLMNEQAAGRAHDRFAREVQLTSQLTHPNTIAIYDYGRTEDGTFYYAMEHLDGMDLEAIVAAAGTFTPARVIHVLRQACGALEEAHAAGLLHRDIKPSNLFLCPKRGVPDMLKVLDFGLVKNLREDHATAGSSTHFDALVGTPHYMSPELVTDPHRVDARSDIYALGAVAYYLLAGAPVFSGRSVVEICSQHVYATPQAPSQRSGRNVPRDLEAIVLRCLAKDPAERYASARALRDALDACKDAESWTEQDAAAWWERHGELMTAARDRATREAPATIVVDLAERAARADRALFEVTAPQARIA